MKLLVNTEPQEIPEKSTLHYLVHLLNLEKRRGMAIAVNEEVVPFAKWNDCVLKENDSVLMIQPSQGG